MIVVDEHSDGQAVELAIGQEVEVALPENPTTGYRWRLESSGEPACAGAGDAFEPPDPPTPGRGGTHRWRFRAERAGRGTIALALRRAWERPGAPARTFRVEVVVTGAG
jgi:inhibitor of cysteine peptidase